MKDISYATTFLPQSRMSAFSHLAEIARLSPQCPLSGVKRTFLPRISMSGQFRSIPVSSDKLIILQH